MILSSSRCWRYDVETVGPENSDCRNAYLAVVELTSASQLLQIATLGGLLGYGVLWLGLDVDPWTAAIILATVVRCRDQGGRGQSFRARRHA